MSFEDQNGAAPAAAEGLSVADAPAALPAVVETVNDAPRSMEDTAGEVWDKLNPPRDNGKFAAKAPEKVEPAAAQSEAPTDPEASPAPAGEAPKAPVSWPKEQAELWSKLDPAARDYILRRETEVEKGFQTTAEKYKPYEELDKVFEPLKARLEAEGLSIPKMAQRLLHAQTILENNPVQGIAWLARSYGVDLGKFAAQPAGNEQDQGQPQPLVDPRVETLQQRIDRLEQEAVQRKQSDAANLQQSLMSEVEKFRASPEHPHFEDVKKDMAALMAAGQAADLEEAYGKAVWVNPTVRAKVLEDQRKAEAAKASEAAAKARQAGSLNVRSTPANTAPSRSVDETLAAAWDAMQQQ